LTTPRSVERAARLGIRTVEVMLQAHAEYQPAAMREIAAIARSAEVRIHAVHTMQRYHPVFDVYQPRVEEGWELFARAAEGAALLGAGALVWHGACGPRDRDSADAPGLLEAVDRLAGLCREHGVALALENVSWCALAQTRDVMTFASRIPELANAEGIGFAFDPFQAARAGANPFMVLAAMEGRLLDVHLRDFRQAEPDAQGLVPGAGDLPWPALIRAIANAGYRGPLILECAMGDAPEATLADVRRLLQPLVDAAASDGTDCDGPPPPGVLEGIRLFNERKFYECHEEIEHEWHAERGPVRRLYQGILQIGVGFHHARSGNHRGAVLLLTDGIEKVSAFLPSCRGVDTAALVRESQSCLDAIVRGGPGGLADFDWSRVPVIAVDRA
jgi:sugar phosphate isomerase/epimerase